MLGLRVYQVGGLYGLKLCNKRDQLRAGQLPQDQVNADRISGCAGPPLLSAVTLLQADMAPLLPATGKPRWPARRAGDRLDPSVQATGRILPGMDEDLRCQAP
jgi:hypothetical protein